MSGPIVTVAALVEFTTRHGVLIRQGETQAWLLRADLVDPVALISGTEVELRLERDLADRRELEWSS